MRNSILILFFPLYFLNISCSDFAINSDNSVLQEITDFKYILTNNYSNNDTIYVFTYSLDENGRVVNQCYINKMNGYEFNKTFLYDNDGKLKDIMKNGFLYERLFYNSNKIEVFQYTEDLDSAKIAELIYEDNKLVKLTYNFLNNIPKSYFFDFDENFNVIKKSNSSNALEEYLEYDHLIINPFYRLKSIEVMEALRVYLPISTNIYRINQVYPIQGDDYSTNMQFFELYYETDEESRVVKITGGKSLIYSKLFDYNIQ